MSNCPRCGRDHTFDRDAILAGCTAVSAVEFDRSGAIKRLEFFQISAPAIIVPSVTRKVVSRRAIEETRIGTDGNRIIVKSKVV